MMLAPITVDAERTTTVVIGSGLSGLAVASELSRQGIEAIVVDSLDLFGSVTPAVRNAGVTEPATLLERSDILRVLRLYASNHSLDVRSRAKAIELKRTVGSEASADSQQWLIRTSEGVLIADNIVLTRCAQSQLRVFFSSLGIAIGQDIVKAIRALGIYLVGVGDVIAPSTREILRQAKTVSAAICTSRSPRQNTLAAAT